MAKKKVRVTKQLAAPDNDTRSITIERGETKIEAKGETATQLVVGLIATAAVAVGVLIGAAIMGSKGGNSEEVA